MRTTVAALVALATSLLCLGALTFLLTRRLDGDRESKVDVLFIALPILTWGLVSAIGVMARRDWARRSFVVWAIVTSLLWCTLTPYFALFVLAGLLLAGLVVGWPSSKPTSGASR